MVLPIIHHLNLQTVEPVKAEEVKVPPADGTSPEPVPAADRLVPAPEATTDVKTELTPEEAHSADRSATDSSTTEAGSSTADSSQVIEQAPAEIEAFTKERGENPKDEVTGGASTHEAELGQAGEKTSYTSGANSLETVTAAATVLEADVETKEKPIPLPEDTALDVKSVLEISPPKIQQIDNLERVFPNPRNRHSKVSLLRRDTTIREKESKGVFEVILLWHFFDAFKLQIATIFTLFIILFLIYFYRTKQKSTN